VIEGTKEGLETDIDAALADERWPEPLDIINGPLMTGMAEVGRLFNDNQLIVAEVLQSAEVMKAAVTQLEQHMDRVDGANRGTIILATVKGDVHDIGKNLVDIILSNNGFKVVNLGIKVTSEVLIQAAREHEPHVIGLSGLLVKSAQQMVLTAGDFRAAGLDVPVVVGGAALTRRFTHRKIAPAYGALCTYASDAMRGLDLVEKLTDPQKRPALEAEIEELAQADVASERLSTSPVAEVVTTRSATVRTDVEAPPPPDLDRHVEELDLDEVWQYLNPQMLYGKHLGLKGTVRQLAADGDAKYAKLEKVIEELKAEARAGGMTAGATWRFYRATSEGNRLLLADPGHDAAAADWELPRQSGRDGLCLADYVLPGGDHVAIFVTTAGRQVRERVERWKEEGEYLKSHAFAALALETAEAAAECLHQRLRRAWGIADDEPDAVSDLLAARYRGKRYSFGYPACPDLEGQRQLFRALAPDEIGVELTDGDMMEPEASVSALVFHHPDARYFGV
jgi:5-methyltetrahydrofolate--homocysteine methyltransferase